MDLSSSLEREQVAEANMKQNSRSWGRRHATACSSKSGGGGEEKADGEEGALKKRMQQELDAAKEAGGDVDRLVMKSLLAGVRDSGPNTAYKALASIEVRSSALGGVGLLVRARCSRS